MIVLFHCSTAWSQSSQSDSIDSSTGEIIKADSVKISLDAIRKANIKLINGNAAILINAHNDSIISMKDTQIELLREAIDREQKLLIALNKNIELCTKENDKLRRQRNVLGGTTVGFAAILILLLF